MIVGPTTATVSMEGAALHSTSFGGGGALAGGGGLAAGGGDLEPGDGEIEGDGDGESLGRGGGGDARIVF